MICKQCWVYAAWAGGSLVAAVLLLHLFFYFRLSRDVFLKHSYDLQQQKIAEIKQAIRTADARLTDPQADYIRRKNAFDRTHGI
jgi:hypothetical protein